MTESANKDLAAIQLKAYELLHRTCGDCRGAKVDALWRPILDYVSGEQPVVPIFTLNYDWTFEKLAIENAQRYHLTDGFELLGGTWEGERFAKLRPSRRKINLALQAARPDLLGGRHEVQDTVRTRFPLRGPMPESPDVFSR